MAENTQVQKPTIPGDIISTEDIGSYKIPRSKICLGATDVDGGNVTAANPFPIARQTGNKTFSQVGISTTAVQILAANSSRKQAQIANNSLTQTLYLGKDNTVTTSNGFPLAPGATLIDNFTVDAWWGVTSSGTIDTRIFEVA